MLGKLIKAFFLICVLLFIHAVVNYSYVFLYYQDEMDKYIRALKDAVPPVVVLDRQSMLAQSFMFDYRRKVFGKTVQKTKRSAQEIMFYYDKELLSHGWSKTTQVESFFKKIFRYNKHIYEKKEGNCIYRIAISLPEKGNLPETTNREYKYRVYVSCVGMPEQTVIQSKLRFI